MTNRTIDYLLALFLILGIAIACASPYDPQTGEEWETDCEFHDCWE